MLRTNYLAVICLPGLEAPQKIQFEPSVHEDSFTTIGLDEQEDNNDIGLKVCCGVKQPLIIIKDSLAGPSRYSTLQILINICNVNETPRSWMVILSNIIKAASLDVLKQNNLHDCGVDILQYVESFLEDPLEMNSQVLMDGTELEIRDDGCFIHELTHMLPGRKRPDLKNT
ncbi:sentrin-specific protease 6 isoform X7 [Biomphalaria pfeifferi]|uniref:Sentrin-specific protease 6 isoform X7 n=1 Tax=Biomphalaria pfeifferi TaxID=112525 RepID=A0AAD8EVJ3_BIOPF|nr:sentrin-specific protease 6 isoform X7 [Biomphalaria pfeifferi]